MINKALIITCDVEPGGAERRYARFFSHICKEHENIYLIINNKLKKSLEIKGINLQGNNVIEINDLKNKSLYENIRRFIEIIFISKQNNIKHIHYCIDPNVLALIHAILGMLYKITYSISVVDSSKKKKSDFSIKNYYLWKYGIRNAIRLEFLSMGIKKNLEDMLFLKDIRSKANIIAPCSFTDYSNSYNFDRIYDFVFISRLENTKGITDLFDALFLIEKKYKEKLSIIGKIGIFGKGTLEKEVKKRITELNCFDIEFGFINNPFFILSKAKYFLSLQRYENYPSQTILEAMACGAIVIATDVGETQKIVKPELGLLTKSEPNTLAKSLLYAIENYDCLSYKSNIAKNFALSNHNIDHYSQHLLAFLNLP